LENNVGRIEQKDKIKVALKIRLVEEDVGGLYTYMTSSAKSHVYDLGVRIGAETFKRIRQSY
jgi:hypothetical protein